VPLYARDLSPVAWGLLAAAVVAAAAGAESAGGPEMPERVGDLIAGLGLVGGGAIAWWRRPGAGAGRLMLLSGVAWFAGDLWSALLYAHRGPLVHLLLTYPSGRSSSRVTLLVIAAAYVDGLIPALARSEWITLALAGAVVLVAAWRRHASGGVERRARGTALACAAVLGGALAFGALGRLADAGVETAAVWTLYGAVFAIAWAVTVDLLWGRWGRAAATGLVIDLGDHHEPRALRAALARTLGDPGLELAYRADGSGGWVDEAGMPVQVPARDARDGRTVTVIGAADAPVAALVHDPAALSDPRLLDAVAAAAGLAVANVGLQAEVAGRVRDVAASRRRLVEAGDEERRRLAAECREGPEERLAEVAARLKRLADDTDGEAAATFRRLTDEVVIARTRLQDFAQGIRPRLLGEGGLRAALAELVEQSGVPVTLDVPDRRFPPAQELVGYYVCSEALANVAKYAHASHVNVDVAAADAELRVVIRDDGIGGADARRGSGLRGLVDRVEALGGRLRVESPQRGGTRVEAVLPTAGKAGG
jgi:signal transduction histidine kinase